MLTTHYVSAVPDSAFSIRNWVDGVQLSLSNDIPFEYHNSTQPPRKRTFNTMADLSDDDDLSSRQHKLNPTYPVDADGRRGDAPKRRRQDVASEPNKGLSIRQRRSNKLGVTPVARLGDLYLTPSESTYSVPTSPSKTDFARPSSPTKGGRNSTASVAWLLQNGYTIEFNHVKIDSLARAPICQIARTTWAEMKARAGQPLDDIRILTMLNGQYDESNEVDRKVICKNILSLTKKGDKLNVDFHLKMADWIQFCKILTKSKRSHADENTTEAAWNNNVHTPILDFAYPENDTGHRVHPVHATQMTIADSSDLPASLVNKDVIVDIPDGKTINTVTSTRVPGAKMIDYLICIDGDDNFEYMMQNYHDYCPASSKVRYVNHTTGNNKINDCPISVSIETKKDGSVASRTEAKNQITIWLLAQLNNLDARFDLAEHYPTLPVILVFGHQWEFFVAERQKEGVLRFWQLSKTLSSSSPEELMRIIELLRYLQDWSHKVHKKWWMEKIAELVAKKASHLPKKGPTVSAAARAGHDTPPASECS